MANPGAPVGQDAYQASIVKGYANAIRCFAQTSNRYGGTSLAVNNAAGFYSPPAPIFARRGRHSRWIPGAGQIAALNNNVTSSGGSGYVVNDLVTFAPLNGGRNIVIKVLAVGGGNPTSTAVVDQGGGALAGSDGTNRTTAQTATLTQLSTTGVGTGATWTANILSFGLGYPQPNPAA